MICFNQWCSFIWDMPWNLIIDAINAHMRHLTQHPRYYGTYIILYFTLIIDKFISESHVFIIHKLYHTCIFYLILIARQTHNLSSFQRSRCWSAFNISKRCHPPKTDLLQFKGHFSHYWSKQLYLIFIMGHD